MQQGRRRLGASASLLLLPADPVVVRRVSQADQAEQRPQEEAAEQLGPAVRGAGNAMVRLFVNGKSNAPQAQLVPKRSPQSLRPAQLALTTSAKQAIKPAAKPVGR